MILMPINEDCIMSKKTDTRASLLLLVFFTTNPNSRKNNPKRATIKPSPISAIDVF